MAVLLPALLAFSQGTGTDVIARNTASARALGSTIESLYGHDRWVTSASGGWNRVVEAISSFYATNARCSEIGGPGEAFNVGPGPYSVCMKADSSAWQHVKFKNYKLKGVAMDVDSAGKKFILEAYIDVVALRSDGGEVPGTATYGMIDFMKLTFDDDGKIVEMDEYPDTYTLRKIKAAGAEGISLAGQAGFSQGQNAPVLVFGFGLVVPLTLIALSMRGSFRFRAPPSVAEPCLLG